MTRSRLTSVIADTLAAELDADAGFITSAVLIFGTVDGDGRERTVLMHDGSMFQVAGLAEYAAHCLNAAIYDAHPST